MHDVSQIVIDWVNSKRSCGTIDCVMAWTRVKDFESCFSVKDPTAVQSLRLTEVGFFHSSTIIDAIIDAFSSFNKLILCELTSSSGEWLSVSSDYDAWSSDDIVTLSKGNNDEAR